MDKSQVKLIIGVSVFLMLYLWVGQYWLKDINHSINPPSKKPQKEQPTKQPSTESNSQSTMSASGNQSNSEAVKTSPTTPTTQTASNTPKEKEDLSNLGEEISFENDVFKAVFQSRGGMLKTLALKNYREKPKDQEPMVLLSGNHFKHQSYNMMKGMILQEEGKDLVVFEAEGFKKSYIFEKGSQFFDIEYQTVQPNQNVSLSIEGVVQKRTDFFDPKLLALYQTKGDQEAGEYFNYPDINNGKAQGRNFAEDQLAWTGFRGKYFACLIHPLTQKPQKLKLYPTDQNNPTLQLEAEAGAGKASYRIYAGPIDRKIQEMGDGKTYAILYDYYCFFDPIANFLISILRTFDSIPLVNMGLAVILLTVFVRGCMLPINLKAQSSMHMMSQLAPDIKKLQEKYKNDKQQLANAQMKLWKESGVNPLSGCLPMLIQMPVFISLFAAIGDSFDMRHEGFMLWIDDLSSPDALFQIPYAFPWIGNYSTGTTNFNFLVVLYVITMVIQQSMMPKSTDPEQAKMQKMMKIVMFSFAFILYNYSSGLMLYWVASNSWSIAESWYIRNKVIPRLKAKQEAKNKG